MKRNGVLRVGKAVIGVMLVRVIQDQNLLVERQVLQPAEEGEEGELPNVAEGGRLR
ncbi:hypothetical protein AGABI2DRAFT_139699 [Agaricus bisporus var. bisporus H97]|uniref:hypothetical protein n=1 Tax=Agaricus bisporus var. bisporus (strain H97 / ATCC MYA-4626 / FGSC 10389) TaxID=936046 RepID=UPI00029F7D59|nr:hypothetical protein AGABI2DRAFT_139699 [Agaricus bisporus var. bisporus H97]EKV41996.1 hypothetical protein AGABI2DRAFT_139699 [Agaricus bisporus var. bisporus H97]